MRRKEREYKMKVTNKTVKKYLRLQARIKKAEKELSLLKDAFLAFNGGESRDYLVTIKHGLREIVAGKDIFAEKLGSEFLAENGLLRTIDTNSVVITEKATLGVAKGA